MDPSLISDPRVQKWVAEISEILDRQLEIKLEIPPVSIFQVPETITSKKPEAYKPQQIGFGPYHHFQPRPYSKMQQKKLFTLQRLLQHHKINDFRGAVLDKVKKLVPIIRACYDSFLQDDNVSMAWVFAIDGLFLLRLFRAYDRGNPINNKRLLLLAQDIMMVENQFPFMVLKEINQALQLHSSSASSDNFSPSIYRSFCEINSPLELCSPLQAPTCAQHLLHYMYRSIINNKPRPIILHEEQSTMAYAPPSTSGITNSISSFLNFLQKVPQKEIVKLCEQVVTSLHNFSTNKTTIPSASELQGATRFRFHDLPNDRGIKHIHVKGNNIICLPCVTLNNDSEVILRNLVAYETLMPHSDHLPLTEYMSLMCGLIVNVEDVKLLKKENIIKGELGEGEVVKIFVGMSGSITSLKTKNKSKLQQVIDEVNKVYESRPRVRAYLLLKKLASWVLVGLTHTGSFVGATWKIVAFMISIVTIFMLTYQAYCDVYGCDKNNVTMLPYASS